MADEECTIEVLETGEHVKCYPDGRKYRLRTTSSLVEGLEAADPELTEAAADLQQELIDRIGEKRAQLDDGRPVPEEKRSL